MEYGVVELGLCLNLSVPEALCYLHGVEYPGCNHSLGQFAEAFATEHGLPYITAEDGCIQSGNYFLAETETGMCECAVVLAADDGISLQEINTHAQQLWDAFGSVAFGEIRVYVGSILGE